MDSPFFNTPSMNDLGNKINYNKYCNNSLKLNCQHNKSTALIICMDISV